MPESDLPLMHGPTSNDASKACVIPFRWKEGRLEILAFRHPLAGLQFVKGSVEPRESAEAAALRELAEESGIVSTEQPILLGSRKIGFPPVVWRIFALASHSLPDRWDHWTSDGGGHMFSFFWHEINADLTDDWHPVFHQAFQLIRLILPDTLSRPERERGAAEGANLDNPRIAP